MPCQAPSPTPGFAPRRGRRAEVDSPADVASGSTPGAKRAAVRKLLHELGIPPEQLPLERFKFLTRLHYCAADTGGRSAGCRVWVRAWVGVGVANGARACGASCTEGSLGGVCERGVIMQCELY